MHRKK
jgi:hypothetical protein